MVKDKKAYIKCSGCKKVFYSGIRIDNRGEVVIDKKVDKLISGVCPSCGYTNSKDRKIELKPPTLVDFGKTPVADMDKTYENLKYDLKIKCSNCGQLRQISGECWNCGSHALKQA